MRSAPGTRTTDVTHWLVNMDTNRTIIALCLCLAFFSLGYYFNPGCERCGPPYNSPIGPDGQEYEPFVPPDIRISDGTFIHSEPPQHEYGRFNESFMIFTITMKPAQEVPITLDYETQEGTAQDQEDYQHISDSLTFAPGETEKNVSITVRNRFISRDAQSFKIILTNPLGKELADSEGIGTIPKPRRPPGAYVKNYDEFDEPRGGRRKIHLGIHHGKWSEDVTVHYATLDENSKCYGRQYESLPAVPNKDFIPINGTLTFSKEGGWQTLSLELLSDEVFDPYKFIALSVNTSDSVLSQQGIFCIEVLDKDYPHFEAHAYEQHEPPPGAKYPAFLRLHMSRPSDRKIVIAYSTVTDKKELEGLNNAVPAYNHFGYESLPAQPNIDFTPAEIEVVFEPGEIKQSLKVEIIGNEIYRPAKKIILEKLYSSPYMYDRYSQYIATVIQEFQGLPSITVSGCSLSEPPAGTTEDMVCTVTLSHRSFPFELYLNTYEDTATEPEDYKHTSARIIFEEGDLEKTFTIPIKGDDIVEGNETIILNGHLMGIGGEKIDWRWFNLPRDAKATIIEGES